jgi:hypothetical protein
LAYFAGIIDGEGCFAMHRHRKHICSTQLQVGNTDPQLMQWIQSRFGGSVNLEQRRNVKHQDVWRWLAAATDLDRILRSLIPYLIVKKRQAELFLAYRATLNAVANVSHSTMRKSDEVKARRGQIHSELAALKRPVKQAVNS